MRPRLIAVRLRPRRVGRARPTAWGRDVLASCRLTIIATFRALFASTREIDVELRGTPWRIVLELSADPSVSDWVTVSDKISVVPKRGSEPERRQITVRLSLVHPFMERFGGANQEEIEPLLRIAAAVGLAEVTARESGVRMAGTFRRNMNELLRTALSKP